MEATPCALCLRLAIVRCSSCQHYCCGRHIWLLVRLKRTGAQYRPVRVYCARCLGLFDSTATE